jgi:hypothetical protein
MAVIVIAVGAAGTTVTTLVNLAALAAPFPQSEVYKTLTLSPAPAAALLVKLTTIVREFNVPESTTALAPKVPVNDQTYPVAAPAVAVAPGNAGAE